ncbi:MAG: phosphoadenosine phosphosulfate reductase family protein [Bacteroidota bacterium]
MKKPKQIIKEAVSKYKPISALLMFSGGHDSLTSSVVAAKILIELGISFKAYHGDTQTGIKETQDFVKMICASMGWDLVIRSPEPPYDYESYVMQYGFPGPAKHPEMMRNLKLKPLRKYITHEVKSKPYARENVLLISGARAEESVIRLGYQETTTKDDSRVWCSPIYYWSKDQCEDFMKANKLPRNPVKDRMCISGECLYGCFAKKEEPAELKSLYPEAWERLDRLSSYSPWKWGQNPSEYKKHNPEGQYDLFTGEVAYMPMCRSCEVKRVSPQPDQS